MEGIVFERFSTFVGCQVIVYHGMLHCGISSKNSEPKMRGAEGIISGVGVSTRTIFEVVLFLGTLVIDQCQSSGRGYRGYRGYYSIS